MRIKTWIILSLNTLLIIVVLVLSFTFYQQFKTALDERVMLQLNSIKNLKEIQIVDFLKREWQEFEQSENDENLAKNISLTIIEEISTYQPGIHDLTHLSNHGYMLIGLIDIKDGKKRLKVVNHDRIQEILLERTGMGNTGETYLVGEDFQLRSQSRFYPDKSPINIEAKTIGVFNGLKGISGNGIFADYRDIEVYSAYQGLDIPNLNWVILSEIDSKEVLIPLIKVRNRLITIALIVIILAILVSLYLAQILSTPIIKMQQNLQQMSVGNYQFEIEENSPLIEIRNMFNDLSDLQQSLSGAVGFSIEIGEMNLKSQYDPKSAQDLLSHSLIKMRDKLIEYQTKESQNTIAVKKLLIEREEIERKRLSMELHDGIGPLLTSLKLYIQNNINNPIIKKEVKTLLDDTIAEIRLVTYDLMPPALIDFGIGKALEKFVSTISKTSELDIHFEDLTLHENSTISSDIGINIFRISQELINNTIKHAEANKVVITLSEFKEYVSLFYFDNGKGYQLPEIILGSGLTNIRERVEIFNGRLDINPENGNATVEIELPLTV